MDNVIIILVIALIVGLAGFYIYKSKKKGQKCIGCPYSKECKTCECRGKGSISE